jgi:O-antigen/teichoic acid export membrane protein
LVSDRSDPVVGRLTSLLARNARVLSAAGLVARLATLATAVVLARGLGEQEFGRYVVAVSFASLLGVLVELGTGGYLVRETAREPRVLGRTTGLVLLLRAGFGIPALAVAALVPPLLGYDRETWLAVVLFTAAAVLRALAATFLSALQALERLRDVAAVQAQQALLAAGAAVAVIAVGGRLIAVSWAFLAVALVSVPWSWRRLRAVEPASVEFDLRRLSQALPVVAGFSGAVLFSTAITYVDSLLVNAFEGDRDTGLYGAAYRILLALYLIPTVYSTAFARSLSQLASANREAFAWLYSRGVCHLTVLALPIALYGLVGAQGLLELLYGEPYADADTALALLLLSVVFTFPAWIASTAAYAAGAERRIAAVVAASFTFNVAANLVAIPVWGIDGAAAVNAATEAITFALLLVVLRRANVSLDWRASLGKPLVAIAPAVVLVLALAAVPLAVRLVLGFGAYALALLLLRTFDAYDVQFVRALAGGRSEGKEDGLSAFEPTRRRPR